MKRFIALIALSAVALSIAVVMGGVRGASAQDTTVAVGDNFYQPASVTVNVGDTVTWNWQGQLPHTVTANDGSFASAQQTTGSFSFTFNQAGTFNYFCQVHGQAMSGSVTVLAAAGEPTQAPAASPTAGGAAPTTGPARTPATGGTAVAAPATGTGDGTGSSGASLWLIAGLVAVSAAGAAGIAFARVRTR